MEIRWTEEAIKHLENTLDFWSKHNYSDDYSNKILIFLARFIGSIRLYQKTFSQREVFIIL